MKGFGTGNQNNFRIWLDEDITKNSKFTSQDSMFEQGSLTDNGVETLNVMIIN